METTHTENLSEKDITKVTIALNSYNSSPWNDDYQRSLNDELTNARSSSADVVVESLRRADIQGYRADEALNGNL